MKIKMLRSANGGGKPCLKGKTYEAPKDMSMTDAVYLVNTKAASEIIAKGEDSEARKPLNSKSGMKGK